MTELPARSLRLRTKGADRCRRPTGEPSRLQGPGRRPVCAGNIPHDMVRNQRILRCAKDFFRNSWAQRVAKTAKSEALDDFRFDW